MGSAFRISLLGIALLLATVANPPPAHAQAGQCGYGYDYDAPSGRCVPDGYARKPRYQRGGPGSCGYGLDWDVRTGTCVPDGYAPKPYGYNSGAGGGPGSCGYGEDWDYRTGNCVPDGYAPKPRRRYYRY
jgi:hypothetical protein